MAIFQQLHLGLLLDLNSCTSNRYFHAAELWPINLEFYDVATFQLDYDVGCRCVRPRERGDFLAIYFDSGPPHGLEAPRRRFDDSGKRWLKLVIELELQFP